MATNTTQGAAPESRSKIVQKDEGESDYLLEYFRSAREELILHFKHRENWVQLQLLSQVVLAALSRGVEIAGIKTSDPYPDVLALSIVISLVLACLYYVDDSLITHLGRYIRSLPAAESKLRPWDSSEHAEHYVQSALPIRYFAQFIAFIIIPTGLFVWRISSFAVWDSLQILEVVINAIFLIIIVFLILHGLLTRVKTYSRRDR